MPASWEWVDPRRKSRNPRRRRPGEGTVRWNGKKALFEVRISITVDGKRKQVSAYAKNEREAYKRLDELKAKSVVSNDGESVTLGWFVTGWLEAVKDSTAPATYRLYKSTAENHIVPNLQHHKLDELSPKDVDAFMAALRPKTTAARRRSVLAILTRILNAAVRKGYLDKNPAMAVEKPRVAKKQTQILTKSQALHLLAITKKKAPRYYPLFVLALGTAMREGELFALHWADVNLDDKHIFVRYSLAETLDGKLERKSTKTGANRKIDISPNASEVLRAIRGSKQADEYVFTTPEGKPLRKSNFLRRVWAPLLVAAELPHVKFHSLRHLSNSVLASEGESITVLQQRGGWASARMPLDVYGHLLEGASRSAADKLDDLV